MYTLKKDANYTNILQRKKTFDKIGHPHNKISKLGMQGLFNIINYV